MITHPLRSGPPLDPDSDVAGPHASHAHAELIRAQAELMHAIAKHRKAWTAMVSYKERITQSGRTWSDTDPVWKIKTSDVAWWAAEMTAQATAVTALLGLVGNHLPGYVEVTAFGDLPNRVFTPGS